MITTEVLIVGGGPTGLVLALWLTRLGVAVRIIDRSAGPGTTSRAIAVHARTLEFYRQIGLTDEAVARGIRIDAMRVNVGRRPIAVFELGDIGQGLSPFPFVLALPQDIHEPLLIEHLHAVGVKVERATELIEFTEANHGVRAVIHKGDSTETCEASYLCGCDGANSTVRRVAGIGFPGGTYDQNFFVADVRAQRDGAAGEIGVHLSSNEFCIVLPVRGTGTIRLIGIVPPMEKELANVRFEDVAERVARTTGLRVDEVNWFSTYRVHHRVADSFRKGRVFLLGDAGHIHSPAGGQGMNTGIGDAVNLSWKLAAVVHGRADPEILDTYETERIAFARWLVRSTDRLFRLIASRSRSAGLVRREYFLRILPKLLKVRAARRGLFRLVSQIRINYRSSALSAGTAGHVHGGDRLPWVTYGSIDNFAPLTTLGWQVHVYGTAGAALRTSAESLGLPLHTFEWSDSVEAAGLMQDALYLVRPDGHVALASPNQDVTALRGYITRWKLHTS